MRRGKAGGCLRIRAHVPHMERPTQSFQITSSLQPHRFYRSPRRRNGGSVVGRSGLPLEAFVALAVIAATLLNPLEVAISTARLIGAVLIETGVHTRLSGRLA
jgi:hypothetical protein